ncbi:hypothetical protein Tco_0264701 [Tanacetum coccineum]
MAASGSRGNEGWRRWSGETKMEVSWWLRGDELIVVVTWEVCVGVVAGATVAAGKVREKWVARYFSFGRHLEDLHVTLAHLEKKRTNTKTLEDLCSQSLETASQAIHDTAQPSKLRVTTFSSTAFSPAALTHTQI